MIKKPIKSRPLRGVRLKHTLAAGIHWFSNFRQDIDAINVFPVADGDTGKNMHQAFMAVLKEIQGIRHNSVAAVAEAAARGALLGGRGSSGMILSGFFSGFAEGVGGRDVLTAEVFAQALHMGCLRARERIDRPREGTILSVGEAAALHALKESGATTDMHRIFVSALEAARRALAETPKHLQVLADNCVVDAGGLGLVCFLEGAVRYLNRAPLTHTAATARPRPLRRPLNLKPAEVYAEHFCVEFILEHCPLSQHELSARLKPRGRELMIAQASDQTYKIHIHVEDGEAILRQAGEWGRVAWHKLEDMRQQHQDAFNWNAAGPARAAQIAIVTDSTADLPAEVQQQLNIRTVPLSVFFGETEYLDGVGFSTDAFYQKLKTGGVWPTTSQPPVGKFLAMYEELKREGYQQALVLTISRQFSGTFQAAANAAAMISGLEVQVVDSHSVSAGLGYLASYARNLAAEGASWAELLAAMEEQVPRIGIYFVAERLDALERGGRISKATALVGKALGLRPILAMAEGLGRITLAAKTFTHRGAIRKAAQRAAQFVRKYGPPRVGTAIIYSDDAAICAPIRQALAKTGADFGTLTDRQIGPVIGTHLGIGGWGIAVC